EVARHVTSVHAISDDEVLRFGNDWWTDRTTLDVAAAENASTAQPTASLDLTEVEGDVNRCGDYAYWGDTVYPHGDFVYAPRFGSSYVGDRHESTLRLYVVDMRGEQPVVSGHVDVESAGHTGDSDRYDYEYFGEILKTESALLVSRVRGSYSYDPETGSRGEQRVT